jgi:hypothetical protein
MRPAIPWLAVPLLVLVLPGLSPIASTPDRLALPGGAGLVADEVQSTLPTQCLAERNHGACVTCCKEAIGCESGGTIPCWVCARFCQNRIPPLPDPGEEPAP